MVVIPIQQYTRVAWLLDVGFILFYKMRYRGRRTRIFNVNILKIIQLAIERYNLIVAFMSIVCCSAAAAAATLTSVASYCSCVNSNTCSICSQLLNRSSALPRSA